MGAFAGLAALGLGIAANAENEKIVQREQDDALTQRILAGNKNRENAQAEVNKVITEQATSTPDDEKSKLLQGLTEQLTKNRPNALAGLQAPAGASSAYNQDAVAAALGIDKAGADRAALTARLDAPVLQRQGEARARQDAAIKLDQIAGDERTNDYITQLKMRGITGSPLLKALAGLAGGAAQTIGRGGASTTNPGAMSNFGSEAGTWYSDPQLWGRA